MYAWIFKTILFTHFSRCNKQIRSLATFSFLAIIFFKFSTEICGSTVTPKLPPVVVFIFKLMWGSCKACGEDVCCNVVAASGPLIGIVREGSMNALCLAMAAAIEGVAEPLLFEVELAVDANGDDEDDTLLVEVEAATMEAFFVEITALGAPTVSPFSAFILFSDDIDNVDDEPHLILAFLLILFVGLDVGGGNI